MFGHSYFGSAYFGPVYWGPAVSITPPAPTIVVVGGRRPRHPYRPKRPRVEAVIRTLADDLAWEPPVPQYAEDEAFLELILTDAL